MHVRKKTTKYTLASIGISLAAIALVAFHLCVKQLDAVALALIGIAFLPWLIPILKSVELPGGWKFEFWDLLEKAEEKLEQTPLLKNQSTEQDASEQLQLILEYIAEQDPGIALTILRREIERRLSALASVTDVPVTQQNIRQLMNTLYNAGIISQDEHSALADIIKVLNYAAHGAEINKDDAEWALRLGKRLLSGLDARSSERSLVAEVVSLVNKFNGQVVPGRLFSLDDDLRLPIFTKVEKEVPLKGQPNTIVDIIASGKTDDWIVDVRVLGSSSKIPQAVFRQLASYKQSSNADIWLVASALVDDTARNEAKQLGIMLSSVPDLMELHRILDL